MELIAVRREKAGPGTVRLVGTVSYEDRPLQTEDYWFEIPAEFAEFLTNSGNPWLTSLTPLAAKLGQPVRIPLPVDPLLARNMRELMAVWKSWYPSYHIVPIMAEFGTAEPPRHRARTGLFFSGGVDSFFSLYHNDRPDPGCFPADDLIVVHGFDMALDRVEAFERHRSRLEAVVKGRGKNLVAVRTNLRSTRLREAPWGAVWHGCGLASVGLLLESRYETLLIASTNHYASLDEWGTHPLTDPLLSTEHVRVLHDGADFRRWEKIEFLSRFEGVLDALHVCFRAGSDTNCGRCEKCLRNMIILEVLGLLEGCEAFPRGGFGLRHVSRILIDQSWQPDFYRGLKRFAATRGRRDVARAIDRAFRRSRARRPLLRLAGRLGRERFVWRLRRPLERLAAGGSPR